MPHLEELQKVLQGLKSNNNNTNTNDNNIGASNHIASPDKSSARGNNSAGGNNNAVGNDGGREVPSNGPVEPHGGGATGNADED